MRHTRIVASNINNLEAQRTRHRRKSPAARKNIKTKNRSKMSIKIPYQVVGHVSTVKKHLNEKVTKYEEIPDSQPLLKVTRALLGFFFSIFCAAPVPKRRFKLMEPRKKSCVIKSGTSFRFIFSERQWLHIVLKELEIFAATEHE